MSGIDKVRKIQDDLKASGADFWFPNFAEVNTATSNFPVLVDAIVELYRRITDIEERLRDD